MTVVTHKKSAKVRSAKDRPITYKSPRNCACRRYHSMAKKKVKKRERNEQQVGKKRTSKRAKQVDKAEEIHDKTSDSEDPEVLPSTPKKMASKAEFLEAPPSGKKKDAPFQLSYVEQKKGEYVNRHYELSTELDPSCFRLCLAVKMHNEAADKKHLTGKYYQHSNGEKGYTHMDVDMPGAIITGSKAQQNYTILIKPDPLIHYYGTVHQYADQWTSIAKQILNDDAVSIHLNSPYIFGTVVKDDKLSRISIIPTQTPSNIGAILFDPEYAATKRLYWKADEKGSYHAKTSHADLDSDFEWTKWKLKKHNFESENSKM